MLAWTSAIIITAIFTVGCSDHELHDIYPFSHTFHADPTYILHWKVDLSKDTVQFAINTSSKGWVGLGLSKTGQMIGSDVMTGWADPSGQIQIQDRFATELSLPSMDVSQDWKLLSGKVFEGNTIIEVERKLTTCDDQDLPITISTAFLVWSMNDETTPTSPGSLAKHTHKGSYAINLLGEVKVRSVPQGSEHFTLGARDVEIPSSKTTYWCQVVKIPNDKNRYIYKFEPNIQEGSEQFVHHMLVYQCPFLNSASSGALKNSSMECDISPSEIRGCRGTNVMSGWAIGGKGFSYPEGVAYPIGPMDSLEYAVLEIHYDNQNQISGHVDSSGMIFHYSHVVPEHKAGVMAVGHHVTSNMLIPPGTGMYEINGHCHGNCTKMFFPKDGINIFGGLLHTHLLGKSLILRHYRKTNTCDGIQELPYVDFNINYDTNYQQVNKFPQETKVLPGDTLSLQCFYDSSKRQTATLGGEGINEEMCLTFLFYYPRQNLTLCTSMPTPPIAYSPLDMIKNYSTLISGKGLQTLGVSNANTINKLLEDVSWSPQLTSNLQAAGKNSPNIQLCLKDFISPNQFSIPPVSAKCSYTPASQCEDSSPVTLSSLPAMTLASPTLTLLLLWASF